MTVGNFLDLVTANTKVCISVSGLVAFNGKATEVFEAFMDYNIKSIFVNQNSDVMNISIYSSLEYSKLKEREKPRPINTNDMSLCDIELAKEFEFNEFVVELSGRNGGIINGKPGSMRSIKKYIDSNWKILNIGCNKGYLNVKVIE